MATNVSRPWARKRRILYGGGLGSVLCIFLFVVLWGVLYQAPTCFDEKANGGERGVDCGGVCVRMCTADVVPPNIRWVEAFRVTQGMHNVVAYVENKNQTAGVQKLSYVMTLYDDAGEILEREGVTEFPPNTLYPLFEGRVLTGNRVPTRASITFDDNPVWVPAEQNGERYMTERRELSHADTKPALMAVIKNESRVEAKDVDVVATILNSAGKALTASRTKVPIFQGGTTKQINFTWQEPIAKTIRTCEVPTDVAVTIDLSGSMNNDGDNPPEPISSVLKAARDFVLRLNDRDQASLISFATEAETISELTPHRGQVATLVQNLEIKPESETGSTNTGDGIRFAIGTLEAGQHNKDARRAIVLLTDGLATAPDPEPENYARDAASEARRKGIEVFTIGLGTELNESFLQEIATDNTHYFRAPTTEKLGDIYASITSALCEEGAAVIEIVPKVTGTYQQL
jgi:Mg-chelatase subunit ChlD